MFSKKDRLAKPRLTFYLQDMKNTLNQSIVSNSIPTTISSQHACYLLFFLENHCEIAALKKQFALTPLQVVEFLTSASVRVAIQEMHDTIRASLVVSALKARDFAMDKLKLVCTDLIRQTSIPSSGIINEPLHAKAINYLRLATSQLGRFAAATIAPSKTQRSKIESVPSESQFPAVFSASSPFPSPTKCQESPFAPDSARDLSAEPERSSSQAATKKLPNSGFPPQSHNTQNSALSTLP